MVQNGMKRGIIILIAIRYNVLQTSAMRKKIICYKMPKNVLYLPYETTYLKKCLLTAIMYQLLFCS